MENTSGKRHSMTSDISSNTSTTSASDTGPVVKELCYSYVPPSRSGSRGWGAATTTTDSKKVQAFLSVVHTNSHSLQIMGHRLQDLDLAHATKNMSPHYRARLQAQVGELDTLMRGWARLFQVLLGKMSEHYRLTKKEQLMIERHVQDMNGVIHLVHKLHLRCSVLQHKDVNVRELMVLQKVDFRLRGVMVSWKRGGLGVLRRTGSAYEAEAIVNSFADLIKTQLCDLDKRVSELAALQHDMLVEERMQIEMDAQAFVEGLRKKFHNGFQSTHEMARSMRTVEQYHNCMVPKEQEGKGEDDKDGDGKTGTEDSKKSDEQKVEVPDADTIVQAVQRALDEERNKWQSQLQTQEINLEIERYHKSVILNKQRQREWHQTIVLVLVALLSAGLAFAIARQHPAVLQHA